LPIQGVPILGVDEPALNTSVGDFEDLNADKNVRPISFLALQQRD